MSSPARRLRRFVAVLGAFGLGIVAVAAAACGTSDRSSTGAGVGRALGPGGSLGAGVTTTTSPPASPASRAVTATTGGPEALSAETVDAALTRLGVTADPQQRACLTEGAGASADAAALFRSATLRPAEAQAAVALFDRCFGGRTGGGSALAPVVGASLPRVERSCLAAALGAMRPDEVAAILAGQNDLVSPDAVARLRACAA